MKSARGDREEEEEDYEEFGAKKDGLSSNSNKDGKSNDKASATRSKHSVTEQRRRSKINERFQILRELIPSSDLRKDTASFLLEVIEYVHYLQERVQKYEGTFQGWNSEPTKLMPWRNSHWRVPNFSGQPQPTKNDVQISPFPVCFNDNNVLISPTMQTTQPIIGHSEPTGDASSKLPDQQPELASSTTFMPMSAQADTPIPVQQGEGAFTHPNLQGPSCGATTSDCPIATEANQEEEPKIEGGTISISSVYSQGLLNSLSQALRNANVDLTQATISVQIDIGKQANRGLMLGESSSKSNENHQYSSHQSAEHFQKASNGEDTDHAQKRMKT